MIRILKRRNGRIRETITVQEEPTPGTWGSHMLYINELRHSDVEWLGTDDGSQYLYNMGFLNYMLAKHGELHCEYCGKPELVITPWKEKVHAKTASTDHFYPKSGHPQLARNVENCIVACISCNGNKKNKKPNKDSIKYPYNEKRIYDEDSIK